jgi:hypothetical protein
MIGYLFPFIIHTPSFTVLMKKGVLMHDMKVRKPKAADQGICNECRAPKLPFFKSTLKAKKRGAWM